MSQRRGKKAFGGRKQNGGAKIIIIVAAVVVVALIAGGVAYYQYQLYQNDLHRQEVSRVLDIDVFYDGVFIDGIPLGGLTPDEARTAIREKQQSLIDEINVSISMGGAVTRFTAKDMTVTFDTEQVLESAWDIGRQGGRESRYEYVLSLPEHPMEFTTTMSVDPAPLESRIMAIPALYNVDPVNAAISKFNTNPDATNRFFFDSEVYGLQVDAQSAWNSVKTLVQERQWGQTVEVQTTEMAPEITIADLEAITQPVAHFETKMSNVKNRIKNIQLACAQITGTVIMPGEEFSFNGTTGERTREAGYVDAPVIIGGNELEDGLAGGICQVSGTLFNALVMADLEITERHHHSFELSYLKRGRDATVDFPSHTDLKAKNNGDKPVYLVMYTDGLTVIAEVYGVPLSDGMTIDIWVKTIEEIDPGPTVYVADKDIPAGGDPEVVRARTGIKCQSYKIYKDKDGNEIRREELILDYYRPYAEEIHVNPADMPGAATPTPTPTPTPTAAPTAEPTATPAP